MTSAKVPICKLARNITYRLLMIELIHTKVIKMLDGTQEILELDIHTATPADVQSFVDARYEAAWRATGVRVLRRDLPFIGPALRTSSHGPLDSTKTLAENGVGKNTTLHTYWPPDHGTRRDRERCAIRELRNEADERMVKRNAKKRLREMLKLARQRVAELAAEIAAAEELNASGMIDVHEDEGDEVGGPEQQRVPPAEDSRVSQAEESQRELVQRGTEGQVDSVPQSVEDLFLTSDQDKENWDPQIAPANLLGQARLSV